MHHDPVKIERRRTPETDTVISGRQHLDVGNVCDSSFTTFIPLGVLIRTDGLMAQQIDQDQQSVSTTCTFEDGKQISALWSSAVPSVSSSIGFELPTRIGVN